MIAPCRDWRSKFREIRFRPLPVALSRPSSQTNWARWPPPTSVRPCGDATGLAPRSNQPVQSKSNRGTVINRIHKPRRNILRKQGPGLKPMGKCSSDLLKSETAALSDARYGTVGTQRSRHCAQRPQNCPRSRNIGTRISACFALPA